MTAIRNLKPHLLFLPSVTLVIVCASIFSLAQERPVSRPDDAAQTEVESLAAALVNAGNEEERNALLAGRKELVTPELAQSLIALGVKFASQNKYQQALTCYGLAYRIAEQTGARKGMARALINTGEVYRLLGKYDQALELYQKGRTLYEALNDKAGIARALNSIGTNYSERGDHSQALGYYKSSLKLYEELDNKEGIAIALNNTGNVYRNQGDYTQALENYQRCRTLFEAIGRKEWLTFVLANIGVVHRLQGDYSQSLEYLRQSLALSEELKNKDRIGNALNSIGNVYLAQGDYSRALEYYQKSLMLAEQIENRPAMAVSLSNIANIHILQGNYPQGLEYLRKSLALCEGLGEKRCAAVALHNIGNVHKEQGAHTQALEYYQKSLALRETMKDAAGIASTLGSIGSAHSAQGDYGRGLEYFQKSLALYESLGDKAGIARTQGNLGEAYQKQGQYRLALEFASRAVDLAKQIGDLNELWPAQICAGAAYRALKQPAQARQSFDDAIATIETLRSQAAGDMQDSRQFFTFENRISPYLAMVDLLVAENSAGAALAYAERAKARALLDVLQSGRVNPTKAMTAQEQEQEQSLKNQLVSLNTQLSHERLRPRPDQLRLTELTARVEKTRLDYEAFHTNLYALRPELKLQRGETRPLTIEEAELLLPDARTALLEFAVAEERTFLFALSRSGAKGRSTGASAVEVKVYPIEIKRQDLVDRARQFRRRLAEENLEFKKQARDLYDLLLKPAQHQLRDKTTLVIVPDGALWELPFQALASSEKRYILEERAIAYAPSLTALREMVKRRSRGGRRTIAPSLLAVGNPALGKETVARVRAVLMDENLDPLPEAERQARLISQLYGPSRSKVYLDAEASEERIKAEAGNYSILHLATHGILNDRNPMYSHILLAQAKMNYKEDGLLEAWEMMNLDLKADLVVLSACETARGKVEAGEGMIGMTWALFVAGCPTAVVSQWKVRSDSASELMVEFHRNLLRGTENQQSPMNKAEALRQAALRLLRNSRYRHPFHWASFIVVGDGF